MAAPRAATVAPPPPLLTNVSYSSPPMTGLATMLSDRQTLVCWNAGFSAAQLGVSTDGGATITYGKDLGGGSFLGAGLIETAGGEVLASIRSRDGSAAGQVWRSTGWNKATADATSWTKVLDCSGPAVWPDGRWAFTQRSLAPAWSARPGALFIAEYGTKVSEAIAAGRASSTAATKAWVSTDDGVTWTKIFDLRDRYAPGLNAGLHIHGIAYDPWDDRVFISTGDGGLLDGGGTAVWYCDGEKLGDLTAWTAIPGTAGVNATTQVTTVIPMETCLLFLSDGGAPGGIRRVARRGWRRYGDFVSVAPIGNGIIGAHAWQNRRPGSPLLLTYYLTGSTPAAPPSILATTDGVTFYEAHREASSTSNTAPGISPVMGPDVNGKVYAIRNMAGTGDLLTGEWAQVGDPAGAASGPAATPVVVQSFTASGTWTKPAGVTTVQVTCLSGGGGGGSGRVSASGTLATGGAGGAGGGHASITLAAALLGATETVTVGAGGTGGAAIASDSTDGANGTAGGASSFGTWVRATGGNQGFGGKSTGAGTGNPGGGGTSWGQTGASSSATGGAGSVPSSTTPHLAPAGGSGGGIATTPAVAAGGAGGSSFVINATGGAVGTSGGGAGGNGTAGAANAPVPGSGGGGGGSALTGAAGAGGNGGGYGSGGGGGGAVLNGQGGSGKGGDGGAGIVVVTCW